MFMIPRRLLALTIAWGAACSLALVPNQQALAASADAARLHQATQFVNRWGTVGSALAGLKKMGLVTQAQGIARLVKKIGMDEKLPFPKFTINGDRLYIDGFSRPIQIHGLNPIILKGNGKTLVLRADEPEHLERTYTSLKQFFEKEPSAVGQIWDLLLPSAHAGGIELAMGFLIFGVILAGVGNAMNKKSSKSDEGDDREMDEGDDREMDDFNRRMLSLEKEEKPKLAEMFCSPDSGLKGKAELAQMFANGNSPKIEEMYAGSKSKPNMGDESPYLVKDYEITLVRNLGAGKFETVHYTFLLGKDKKWTVTAKAREGRPVRSYVKRTSKPEDPGPWQFWRFPPPDGYWGLLEELKNDGTKISAEEARRSLVDKDVKTWSFSAGKDMKLPVKSVGPKEIEMLYHRGSEIFEWCKDPHVIASLKKKFDENMPVPEAPSSAPVEKAPEHNAKDAT